MKSARTWRPSRASLADGRIIVTLASLGVFKPLSLPTTFCPEKVRVLGLVSLIELKLAARRLKDFAVVLELIRFNGLDEGFAANLHPSVRPDYIECLEKKRREGCYAIRRGELDAGPKGK